MIVEGIEFGEMELRGLRGAMLDGAAGELLGKVLLRVQEEGFDGVRDAQASIERIRYSQGLLDGLDRFQKIVGRIVAIDPDEINENEDIQEDLEEEEVADVRG